MGGEPTAPSTVRRIIPRAAPLAAAADVVQCLVNQVGDARLVQGCHEVDGQAGPSNVQRQSCKLKALAEPDRIVVYTFPHGKSLRLTSHVTL